MSTPTGSKIQQVPFIALKLQRRSNMGQINIGSEACCIQVRFKSIFSEALSLIYIPVSRDFCDSMASR